MKIIKNMSLPVRKLILISVIGVNAILLYDIPYLNVFLNIPMMVFIVWLVAVLIFNLSSKFLIYSMFVLFMYCMVLLLMNFEPEAQKWGDFTFFILIIALLKFYLENRKVIINT